MQTAPGHGRLEDRSNNFTAMRIGFAVLILYGHALMLPQGLPMNGAWAVLVDTVVQYALDGFFILSGYMLAASLFHSRDMTGYWLSRGLRIFPGLIVAVLLCWLALGPVMTGLPLAAYFTSLESWAYPFLAISQLEPQGTLPGVFTANPMAEINGPLWTIRYELVCYVLAGAAATVGVWRRSWGVPVLFTLAVMVSLTVQAFPYSGPLDDTVEVMSRFGPAFLTGAMFYRFRHRIALNAAGAALLCLGAFALYATPAGMIGGQIASAYVFLWLGFKTVPGEIGRQVREVEDISYGLYILHWPVGQVCVALNPDIGTGAMFAIMGTSTLLMAVLLRRVVEKPALRVKPCLRSALDSATTGRFTTTLEVASRAVTRLHQRVQ